MDIVVWFEPTATDVVAAIQRRTRLMRWTRAVIATIAVTTAGIDLVLGVLAGGGAELLLTALGAVGLVLIAGVLVAGLAAHSRSLPTSLAALCLPTNIRLTDAGFAITRTKVGGHEVDGAMWVQARVFTTRGAWMISARRLIAVVPKRSLTGHDRDAFVEFVAGRGRTHSSV
jgi:hypothetical protein